MTAQNYCGLETQFEAVFSVYGSLLKPEDGSGIKHFFDYALWTMLCGFLHQCGIKQSDFAA